MISRVLSWWSEIFTDLNDVDRGEAGIFLMASLFVVDGIIIGAIMGARALLGLL